MIQTNWTEVKHLLLTDDDSNTSMSVITVQPGEDVHDKVVLAIREHFCIEGGEVNLPNKELDLYRATDLYVVVVDGDGDAYNLHIGITLICVYP